jgi:hypothetical protein
MLSRTRWLTIFVILISIILAFVIRNSVDSVFLPKFANTFSILVTIGLAAIMLIFVFNPVRKQILSLNIAQEKSKEAENLLKRS